jgi:hypothetical protein
MSVQEPQNRQKKIEKTGNCGQILRRMNPAPLIFAIVCLVGVSCERHSWEETKVLHKHGASHGADSGHGASAPDGHGDKAADKPAHEAAGSHAAPAAHAEH